VRFSNPTPTRFGGPLRINPNRPPYNGDQHAGNRRSGWDQGNRDRDHDGDWDHDGDRDRHRRPYWRGYGLGFSYGYPGWPGYPFLWNLSACILGCDASDYNGYGYPYGYGAGYGTPGAAPYGQYGGQYGDATMQYPGYPAAPNNGAGEEYSQVPADASPAARAPYTGQVQVSSLPTPQQAVKLIFKDGRSPEQIRNYMLTSTTLTVLDQKYREIPLDQIDLAATRQSNLADGIDFRVPHASR